MNLFSRRRRLEPLLLDYERTRIELHPSSRKRRRSVAKEPYTVAWLEESLRPGDVLYDVGANVGAYSLVAAVAQPEAHVLAFEPGFESYAALCQNLVLNKLGGRVTALPVALGARSQLASFEYRHLGPGQAQHHLGDNPPFEPEFEQRLIEVRLDDLVELLGLPHPTHMKVDVDGSELAVLSGADRVLRSETLRELQLEVDPGDRRIEEALAAYGFSAVATNETPQVLNIRFARA